MSAANETPALAAAAPWATPVRCTRCGSAELTMGDVPAPAIVPLPRRTVERCQALAERVLLFSETPDRRSRHPSTRAGGFAPSAGLACRGAINAKMNTESTVLDAPGAAPELLIHEWADNSECINPETVTIDFGAKRGKREAAILLGSRPDGTWRVGWALATKDGTRHTEACTAAGSEWPHRSAALRIGLGQASRLFEGDAPAVRACSAMFGKTFPPTAADEGSAPNIAPSDARPLPKARFAELSVKTIERNPEQPRQDFPPARLQELADSIASVGLLEPIVVRLLLPAELAELPGIEPSERYEIMAGERRHRAFVMLERDTIPCMVYEGLTRAQAAAPALIENLQREGLNAIEEAIGYRDLMAREGLTQEQCAQRVGKSRPTIANALRVLELPEKVIALIRKGKLTAAHGTALARFKAWPKVAEAIAEIAAKEKATTAEIEGGLPFADDLIKAGLAAEIDNSKFHYSVPPSLKKHPSYVAGDESRCSYLLDVTFYEEALAKKREELKKEADKARANQAKKKPGAKTLEDLKGSVHVLNAAQEDLALELLPDKSINEVKKASWSSEKVTVCTHAELAKKVDAALATLRATDRKAKLPPLIEKAQKKIATIKKLGAREFALLFLWAQQETCAGLDADTAKRHGVKLPKLSSHLGYSIKLEDLRALAGLDAVGLFRAMLEANLSARLEEEDELSLDGDAANLLRWILEVDDFGLLENTKEGQQQLVDAVKTEEWYQRELAKIEGREYVPSASAENTSQEKASKKTPAKTKRTVIDDGIRSEVLKLVNAGNTGAEIAKKVGISLPSVQNIKKARGLVRR